MKNKILLIIILLGITIWNIPSTTSIFQGQHTFYNTTQIPCEKCHQDIQDILNQPQKPYPKHNEIGCKNCHTSDGNSSHAASIKQCNDCHLVDRHQISYPDCNICHISHGGQKLGGELHENCKDCHIQSSNIHHLMISQKRTTFRCMDCHPRINGQIIVERDCMACHNGTSFWANPNFNISINNHHNFTSTIQNCSICHGNS